MKNWWIRFGCFLTGFNYRIVRNSSEVTAKAVKRYTSSILIVCTIWSFIGYFFTDRYLHGGMIGSFAGGAIFVIIVIQIERQIILSVNPGKWLYIFRGMIAMTMAILGAIIVDQVIFKEDIELEKITFIEERIKKALPPKTEELNSQIAKLDTAIDKKENERLSLIEDVGNHPTSIVYSTQSTTKIEKRTTTDTSGKQLITENTVPVNITVKSNVINPKAALIAPIEENIKNLRIQKAEKEAAVLNIRPQLEKEISAKTGFLDELKVMYALISDSGVALMVWLIWFFFLLGLEMLVVISKANEKENDYEKTIKHHMELQKRKLDLMYARLTDGVV